MSSPGRSTPGCGPVAGSGAPCGSSGAGWFGLSLLGRPPVAKNEARVVLEYSRTPAPPASVSTSTYTRPQEGESLESASGFWTVAPTRSAVTEPVTPPPVTGERDQETRAVGSRTTVRPVAS